MLSFFLSLIFLKLPQIHLTEAEQTAFKQLLSETKEGAEIDYQLPYEKYKFLYYLSTLNQFLFHGSNVKDIVQFEPRQQTLFNNKVVTAIFASQEPAWSLFYSVLNRKKVHRNFRNGCLVSKNAKYVYYSLTEQTMIASPWTSGMMYILPKAIFIRADMNKVYFDEWISVEPVMPQFKIKIEVDDFPYKNKVAVHNEHEHIYRTLLSYKMRTKLRHK